MTVVAITEVSHQSQNGLRSILSPVVCGRGSDNKVYIVDNFSIVSSFS